MGDHDADQRSLYANCTLCGSAIRWGDPVVTIARYEEQVRADGDIEVVGENTLASLCSTCGKRYPAAAIRLDLGGRLFSGTQVPGS